ncbi:uncharacterized protein N0V89_007203 [Didymosphaeria variabile]|uniref:Uncharacterized protein n=1 Tax=Didymosphaeria variabile TaxID=1932322 RepID=A0A9W8XIQ5_9PLEO|nr:uncharacterized protein N0V89_007203 [Didymosphaeria variabile]KAJ4351859.1 hypothetical protein N0V89_007203 [Didymosphaeria variabile]
MSTIAPSEAGFDVAWADSEPIKSLPLADQIPRTAHGFSNVNIDIPLDSQTSLSMELTHEADPCDRPRPRGRSAVAKYAQDGQNSLRPYDSDTDTVPASPNRIEAAKKIVSPQSIESTHSPRKPIPSPWKTTQPRAPVFQTDRRKEEREKRKSVQGSLSPTKSLRSTYLTKDAIEPVTSDITSAPGLPSPTKLPRHQSKASLQSPSSSPARSSPREAAMLKIQVSPARSNWSNVQGHGTASNVQDLGRAPSVTPSVTSNQGTEYHSAHSPVSSRDTWHTAEDHDLEPPFLSLVSADDFEQDQHGQTSIRGKSTSQLNSHSRSKTESHVTGQKVIRPAVPNLTLCIPHNKQSTNHKPPFKAGSASSPNSGSSVSPTKPSSRIPRVAHTFDAGTKASNLKLSQSTKSLKEAKGSSIINNFVNDSLQERLASFLDSVDPSIHPEHTPFMEEDMFIDDNGPLSEPSSRKTSISTVKAVTTAAKQVFAHMDHVDELEAREKESVVKKGISMIEKSNVEAPEPSLEVAGPSSESRQQFLHPRRRSHQEMLQDRPTSVSAHSLRSKASSELRATAPEFFPRLKDELRASAQDAMTTQWMQPYVHNLAFDPFALDAYGMPWFFHMYPVQIKHFYKSPKKYKTMPRGRKRGDDSLSPKKLSRPALINEPLPQEGQKGTEQEPANDAVSPFASQMDEIARNTAGHQSRDTTSPMRRRFMTLPPRSGRPLRDVGNGLYDTFGRGRFRPVGMPIEATAPFPDPIPPSGRKKYVGYAIERTRDGCGVVDIDRAAEWVGKVCNTCEPDH